MPSSSPPPASLPPPPPSPLFFFSPPFVVVVVVVVVWIGRIILFGVIMVWGTPGGISSPQSGLTGKASLTNFLRNRPVIPPLLAEVNGHTPPVPVCRRRDGPWRRTRPSGADRQLNDRPETRHSGSLAPIESFQTNWLASGHHGDSWTNKPTKPDNRVSPLSHH